MNQKLDQYFNLVEQSRNITSSSEINSLKAKSRDVKRKIRKLSTTIADPNTDINDVMKQIAKLKDEQRNIIKVMSEAGEVDKTSVKRRIVDTRNEILQASYHDSWKDLIHYFKKNPVALTSLIHQVGYDQLDSVKILRTLPFRGRVSGPYGTRYSYEVEFVDGVKKQFSSVRKVILALDQYNRDFRSLALTYDALNRYVDRGLSINEQKIAKINRNSRD